MTALPSTDRVFLAQFCRHDCWCRPTCEWVWEGKEEEQCPAFLAFAERLKWHKIECWKPNTYVDPTYKTTYETNINSPPPAWEHNSHKEEGEKDYDNSHQFYKPSAP